ncbi:MAG: folylpolyglutamate synthase/dihydrofolate synthase family protein [Halieaceae bacterium]|jgi:dihydrofolate synthase/folylpolyglutamate synthase|nr:folylpolyglutamate synthase/dihydrofolate synthase family protein [Halieaceae bacterium]
MTDRSLADWLSRLEGLHPKEIDLGLDRVREVAARMGLLPPALAKTVIVAGTNGKGSVVSLLERALVAEGVRCGAYTSPHLVDFNERIRIDGSPVSDRVITAAFAEIERARAAISLTYFEFATLAALWIFREQEVSWQILEVGLGGRLDAVNIIDADLSVVTSIGLDHQDWLGPDREHIAVEKVQVARMGRPCVVLDEDPPTTLLPALDALGARIVLLGRDFKLQGQTVETLAGARCPLPQPAGLLNANIAGAVQAWELMGFDPSSLSREQSMGGTQLPGRRQCQRLEGVEWVFDVAHNREAVAQLLAWCDARPASGRTFAIYASLSDKPFRDILAAVSDRVQHWFFPRFPEVARAVDPAEFGLETDAQICPNFEDAWQQASRMAQAGDRVLVFGSFVTVGAALTRMAAVSPAGN